jgi:hypothetical protein
LSTGPFDYHIIPLQKIISCEIVTQKDPSPERSKDDGGATKEREKQAKLKEERLIKPPGVSSAGYKIFLMLGKT